MAGLVIPWMLSRKIFLWRLAPPLPRPLPPLPPMHLVSTVYDVLRVYAEVMRRVANSSDGDYGHNMYLRPVMLMDVCCLR